MSDRATGKTGDNSRNGDVEEAMQTDAVPYSSATSSNTSPRPDSVPIQEKDNGQGQSAPRASSQRAPRGRGSCQAGEAGSRLVNEETLRYLPPGVRASVKQTLRDAERVLEEAGITGDPQKKKPGHAGGKYKQSGPSGSSTKSDTTAGGDKPWGQFKEAKGSINVKSFVGCQNLQIGDKNVFYYTQNNYVGNKKGKPGVDADDSRDAMTKEQASDEQVERVKEMTREVSAEELQSLSEHVGGSWRRLGRTVGFSDGELDNLYHDFKGEGLQEACYQMLRKWKERSGNQATVGALAEALIHIRQQEIIRLVFIGKATPR